MFADYLESVAPAPSSLFMQVNNELDDYLSTPIESLKYKDLNSKEQTMTPMEWWVCNRDKYPKLLQMALDYLSIPCKCTSAFTKPLTNGMLSYSC